MGAEGRGWSKNEDNKEDDSRTPNRLRLSASKPKNRWKLLWYTKMTISNCTATDDHKSTAVVNQRCSFPMNNFSFAAVEKGAKLDLQWFREKRDLWFTPPPPSHQPSLDQNQHPQGDMPPPPHAKCHPQPVRHGDGGSEVPWPLGPNLVFLLSGIWHVVLPVQFLWLDLAGQLPSAALQVINF